MSTTRTTRRRNNIYAWLFLLAAFALQCVVWTQLRHKDAQWANVPPPPSARGAAVAFLGDEQLAYRAIGITLQNLGDSGRRVTPFDKYHYDRLGRWFHIMDELDPASNYMPLLAAFYYSAVKDPVKLNNVIDYLAEVGQRPQSHKWRWLAQAVYLARFKQGDLARAEELAEILAGMYRPGMPAWVVQMPIFIQLQQEDREAAYNLAISLLRDESGNMHPNEIIFMKSYICERILNPEEVMRNPLCEDFTPR